MYLLSKIEALLAPDCPVALPPPLDDTGKIIMLAADLIRKHGWCTGSWFGPDGSLCAMGALYFAISGKRLRSIDDSHPAIQRVIRYLGGGTRGTVEGWNDRRSRGGEVISMLESAARYVR